MASEAGGKADEAAKKDLPPALLARLKARGILKVSHSGGVGGEAAYSHDVATSHTAGTLLCSWVSFRLSPPFDWAHTHRWGQQWAGAQARVRG